MRGHRFAFGGVEIVGVEAGGTERVTRTTERRAAKEAQGFARRVDRIGGVRWIVAYRLQRDKGKLETFKNDMLEALCDVLDVTPGDLFEREKLKRR